MHNPSFRGWVQGNLGRQEARQWDHWIEADERNRKAAREAAGRMADFSFADPSLPSPDKEWEAIRKQAGVKKGTYSSGLLQSRFSEKFIWVLKAAAVFLVAISMGWLIVPDSPLPNQKLTEEQVLLVNEAQSGENKFMTLPDGSSIVLAPGSGLYHRDDWLSKPVKHLRLEGEALFSIAPGEQSTHPKLVVETDDGTTAVWGTRFSVSTLGEGTQVVLEEGEVRVNVSGFNGDNENRVIVPGQRANFKKFDRAIDIQEVNPLVYTSWATGKLVFDNTPVLLLFDRIERTYGVNVEIKNEEILNRELSGSIRFENLDSLIQAISEVLKTDITRTGNTVLINGNKPN